MHLARRARRGFAFAAAVLGVGLAVGTAAPRAASAGDQPTKRYRDPNAKFSFMLFDDFDPVPIEQKGEGLSWGDTDKFMVARHMQRGADKRGVAPAEVVSFRIGKNAEGQSSGVTTPGDAAGEDEFTKRLRQLAKEDDPKTMKELLEKELERYSWGKTSLLDPKQSKEVKSKDGVVGRMWVVERKLDENGPPQGFRNLPNYVVCAAWKKGDMEIGLFLIAPGESKKKFEQGFQSVVRSFTFFDPKAEDVPTQDVLKDLPISPAKKRQIERGLVKGWAIRVSPGRNYIVIYNTKGKRNDLLAKIIAERIEAIRAQVYEVKFPPAQKVEAVSIVRICGDQAEYFVYGGPGGSAGYWNSNAEELVFYDASPRKEPDDDTLAVLYHEAFHQYIYYSVGEVAPHSWFNEGTGDYFAGAKYVGGKFTIRPFSWRTETIRNAIRAGPCAYEERTRNGETEYRFDRAKHGYTPLKPFVRMSQGDYYDENIGVNYAQGWSFIYFLREGVPKDAKMNAKWGKILDTYFDTLKAEVNREKPLKPKGGKPEPGMDDPGMDDPSDDPGMDDPGMGDPSTPGMDDPGMGGEPPGMGDPPSGGGDGPDPSLNIPRTFSRFGESEAALKKAVDAAFKDYKDSDYEELEAAWKAFTLKVH